MSVDDRLPIHLERVLYHEAGHAVAVLVLWDDTADIVLHFRANSDGEDVLEASYHAKDILNDKMLTAPLMDVVQVLAAGKQAERHFFDIESEGFGTDKSKIDQVFRLRQRADEELRTAARAEMENDYPKTLKLVQRHHKAISAIARDALKELDVREANNENTEGAVILPAERVRQIFCDSSDWQRAE